jgi:formate dehydrogenase iron-sulfur subunit
MLRATQRVADVHERGVQSAYIYGDQAIGGTGGMAGLNAFFILTAEPETYNLPAFPVLPQAKTRSAFLTTCGAALALGLAAVVTLRGR